MATIVGGLAASHGPLLCTPPSIWHLRASADRRNCGHWYRGQQLAYEALLALRNPGFDREVRTENQEKAYAACQQSLDTLAARFKAMNADYVVIVGNDQREVFKEDLSPALLVYTGESVENVPLTPDQLATLSPGVAEAEEGHCPPQGATYPGLPSEAVQLAGLLADQSFDVATSARLPRGVDRQEGIPHAFGFIYRRILSDAPPPSIPIFVNVGVAPNQVRVPRALAFGTALARAIRQLPGSARVVLIASGGLTHFVVDEEFDRRVLAALDPLDTVAYEAMPESWFNGNSAEIKSWLVVAAAMKEAGLHLGSSEYTACYRTPAGTGSGMGFVSWS
jgi:Catalytic LigB subunit of aromatic ring-opening dioxygenase